ncbi:MarR family winged helix-turn-helix transcriptional regulator [Saccharothrix obliqua]|uniref:MarR family winged helix-turn-helix transcriptional regulator n=1 Tax=Saccharothrix obliqua TaxID=2861747 RepID=UPI0027E25091|nr:MarR family transcriptional regulator [Saccharothrix obliqua]
MTALTDRGEEFSTLLIEVFRVNGLLLAAGDALAGPSGLSSARWQVLGVIDHGPRTVAGVARAMGLTRQAVRQTATGLVRDGMVEFRDNPLDRRARLLDLTPRGRTALRAVERRQAEWANGLGARLSLPELRAAVATLRDLADLLEDR